MQEAIEQNLSDEIIGAMRQLKIHEANIQKFQQTQHYVTAQGTKPDVQKTYLTLALAGVLNSGPEPVPAEIRLGLNMAGSIEHWLQDVRLIVLPFIELNQDRLFA